VAERLEANRHGAEQAAPDPEQPDADGEQGTAEPAAADPAGLSHRVTVTVRNSISGKVIYGPEELSGMTTVRDLQHKVVQGFAMQVLHGARILPEDCELGRLRTEQTASSSSSSGEVPSLELGMHIEARRLLGVFRSAEEEDELREDDAAVLEELEATYMALAEVGSGTFAKVYKAMRIDDASQSLVAIKKLAIDADEGGIPAAAIREVALVKKLDHPNVAQIHHVYSTSFCLFLVFELLDMDLRKYMRTYGHFASPEPLQQAALQCCRALQHCHVQRILHRDLKPQNILVNVESMTLKLADFGLARSFSLPMRAYTPEVVTLWYRAPELLLGSTTCGTSLDIWSMACIIAEMATGRTLFAGDSEIDTLFRIFRLLGTPGEEAWSGVKELPHFQHCFPVWQDTALAELRVQGPSLGSDGIDLLQRCFAYDPRLRLSARRATAHPFFGALS